MPEIKSLYIAIIERAVMDYRILQKKEKDSLVVQRQKISKADIEKFFRSKWCEFLLENLSPNMTGEYILKIIK